MGEKLSIGWFTFTCCEDSSILFVELLNDHFFEWKKKIEFKHCKMLKTKNVMGPFDVAFIEGAISNDEEANEAKKIRSLSKKVIAIGSCACSGSPSNQRNYFSPEQKARIAPLLEKFKLFGEVKRLDQVITIDGRVDGCPMDEKKFLEVLNTLLEEVKE
ncbi:hypothetical protein HY990_03960 [Candidatus Micrarchaeota archaeon]|nr:hypothetical protein [Candidatus Micrarchaeota archaeon]